MNWKKKLLYASKLYFILDIDTASNSPIYIIRKILKTKIVDIIQLRDKSDSKDKVFALAKTIKRLLYKSNILFIINDYIDIAGSIDADGLHLGQKDLPLPLARRVLGKNKIIGISCHSLEEAKEAEQMGADYVSMGPVFPTPLKPKYKYLGIDIFKKLYQHISIPCFAIGGIDLSNIDKLLSLKVDRFAFSRLLGTAEDLDLVMDRLEEKILYLK